MSLSTTEKLSRHIVFGVVDKRAMLLIRDDDNDIASLIMTILFISLFSRLCADAALQALLRFRFARHKTNETVIIIVMVIVGG